MGMPWYACAETAKKMMKPRLYIIRGIPGSGKTTLANHLKFILTMDFFAHNIKCDHVEADQFFIKRSGEYVFNRDKLKDAHSWCQGMVCDSMERNHNIIVSNTFVKKWEMQAYLDFAKDFGYEVFILVANGNFQNTHGVPDEVVNRMREQFEF